MKPIILKRAVMVMAALVLGIFSVVVFPKALTEAELIVQTIQRIKQGGPFPYPDKDGRIFYNREGRLPKKPRGYYHEYTVPTPQAQNRGARRIVTGGNPPEIYYYTRDHYHTFIILDPAL